MAKTKSEVSQIHAQSSEQDIVQKASPSEQQALSSEKKVVRRVEPRYPSWPTSKPGPLSTSPFAGMGSVNPFRPEQVTHIVYNQEANQPSADNLQQSGADTSIQSSTSFDQPRTAQDILGKRRQRL